MNAEHICNLQDALRSTIIARPGGRPTRRRRKETTRMTCIQRRELLAAGLAAAAWPAATRAQPAKPVTMIVPFAPGGGTDSIARDLGKAMERELGKPVVIDNRGGAGGAIAAASVAKAAADGSTLLFVTSTFVSHAASDPTAPYDVTRDFAPVAMLGRGPLLLVASKPSGLKTVAELVAKAKQEPHAVSYCSAGPGSINHMSAALFEQKAGIRMTHVPYRGSGPALIDLIAGRTQVFFSTVPTILAQLKDDKVTLLAATSRARSSLYPSTPTVIESGVPDFETSTWWGVVAPAGTPPAVVQRLNAVIASAAPAIRGRLLDEGAEPLAGPPDEFGRLMAAELDTWRRLVKSSGMLTR
jgi:tripartite-type tricarboxylate transporter receptor subunit TctC